MIFAELRQAITRRLDVAMPKEVHVATHPGPLDATALQKLCSGAPALHVSILKVASVDRSRGVTAAELRLGVYVVTRPGKGAAADEVALALLPRVLATVDGEDWDTPGVATRPEGLSADNLWTGTLGGHLMALWGVTWRQRVMLPQLVTMPAPTEYPSSSGDMPPPWDDPLAEFLRAQVCLRNEAGDTYADDLITVRDTPHGTPAP